MVDDNELLRIKQMVGNDQRSQRIVGGDAAGIADHMGIAGMQAQAMLEQNTGIHAGQDSDVALGADGEISEGEIAGESFVGL